MTFSFAHSITTTSFSSVSPLLLLLLLFALHRCPFLKFKNYSLFNSKKSTLVNVKQTFMAKNCVPEHEKQCHIARILWSGRTLYAAACWPPGSFCSDGERSIPHFGTSDHTIPCIEWVPSAHLAGMETVAPCWKMEKFQKFKFFPKNKTRQTVDRNCISVNSSSDVIPVCSTLWHYSTKK